MLKEVNIKIKNDLVAYLLGTDNALQLDASYLTNDLKQLETARIEGQLNITIFAFEFLLALVAALAGNLLLTLVYFVASILPVALQRLFQKRSLQLRRLGKKAIVLIQLKSMNYLKIF